MKTLQVTAFRTDFSTLDMEKGEINIVPSESTYIIKPMLISYQYTFDKMSIEEDISEDDGFLE